MSWKEDIDLCKQQVESSINQIKEELPAGTTITVEKMNPSILPVIGYVIDGKGRSNIEINQIANYIVKPFLSQVPGVTEIRVIGGKTKGISGRIGASKNERVKRHSGDDYHSS